MPDSSQDDRTVARAADLDSKEIKRKGGTLKKFSNVMKVLGTVLDALKKIVDILNFLD